MLSAVTLKDLFQSVETAIKEFQEVWPPLVLAAHAYRLPILNEAHVPDAIKVAAVLGDEAIQLSKDAFGALHILPNQDPGTSMRLPGLLVVADDIKPYIDRINSSKDEFKRYCSALPPQVRRTFLRSTLSGVHLLHTYRHINYLDYVPSLVTFSWVTRSHSSEKLDYNQVQDLIKNGYGELKSDSPEIRNEIVEQQLKSISTMQGRRFLRIKPVAPHPRLLVRTDKALPSETINANLPVLISAKNHSNLPTIRPLPDYPHDYRPVRKKRIETIPVVERLGLYVVV